MKEKGGKEVLKKSDGGKIKGQEMGTRQKKQNIVNNQIFLWTMVRVETKLPLLIHFGSD